MFQNGPRIPSAHYTWKRLYMAKYYATLAQYSTYAHLLLAVENGQKQPILDMSTQIYSFTYQDGAVYVDISK